MSEIERGLMDLLHGRPPNQPCSRYDILRKPNCAGPTILGQNIVIIVGAIVFNNNMDVLMIQEAKPRCKGSWYFPCGRLEPNETLVEGVKREFEEETGLTFEPTTIINIESWLIAGYWLRFTFTGYITGGRLKDKTQSDKESLQAMWFNVNQIRQSSDHRINLRSKDFISVLDAAYQYHLRKPQERHPYILPSPVSHKHMCMRVILVKCKENEIQVLLNMDEMPHFPTIKDAWSAEDSLLRLCTDAFGQKNYHGSRNVLCVEHLGQPSCTGDGVCLTLLSNVETDRELSNTKRYMWHTVTHPEIRRIIIDRLMFGRSLRCP